MLQCWTVELGVTRLAGVRSSPLLKVTTKVNGLYLCYRQLTVHPQVHLKGQPQQDRPVQAPPVQL